MLSHRMGKIDAAAHVLVANEFDAIETIPVNQCDDPDACVIRKPPSNDDKFRALHLHKID